MSKEFVPAPHIQLLLKLEEETRSEYGGRLHFDRTGEDTIVVSCSGYKHMDLISAEDQLLKLGCRYDLKRGVQEFDRVCGRTFTYFIEPKSE